MKTIETLCPGVFLQRHPLNLAGCQMGRNVTILRQSDGGLLIHSTADFSPVHVKEIHELGEPRHLLEASKFHDTLTPQGREAFSDLQFYAPTGFKHESSSINSLQEKLDGEVDIIEIAGMPKIRENVIFHRRSKTLVVADLMFNLPSTSSWWTRSFLRLASGMKTYPSMSRLFKFYISDKSAYNASIEQIAELDFDRIVVAHGDPITDNAKERFLSTVKL